MEEALNHMLKTVKALMVVTRGPDNNDLVRSHESAGDVSALMHQVDFIATVIEAIVDMKAPRDKDCVAMSLQIVTGNRMVDKPILNLCAALTKYIAGFQLVELGFIPTVGAFVILLDRCEGRPQEVDELLGALATVLFGFADRKKQSTASFFRGIETQLSLAEKEEMTPKSSVILFALRNWSSRSLNVRRLVCALQHLFVEDRGSYTAKDVGRVICGCRFLRESLSHTSLTMLHDSLEPVFGFDSFVSEMVRMPFSELPFSSSFCQLLADGLISLREGDELFEAILKEFCDGISLRNGDDLPISALLDLVGRVGASSAAWLSPSSRRLLVVTLERVEQYMRSEGARTLEGAQIVDILCACSNCCFRSREMEQLLQLAAAHSQLVDVMALNLTVAEVAAALRGISLLPTDLLAERPMVRLGIFLVRMCTHSVASVEEMNLELALAFIEFLDLLPRFASIWTEAEIEKESEWGQFLDSELLAVASSMLAVLAESDSTGYSLLLKACVGLLRYIPQQQAKQEKVARRIEQLCHRLLCEMYFKREGLSQRGEDLQRWLGTSSGEEGTESVIRLQPEHATDIWSDLSVLPTSLMPRLREAALQCLYSNAFVLDEVALKKCLMCFRLVVFSTHSKKEPLPPLLCATYKTLLVASLEALQNASSRTDTRCPFPFYDLPDGDGQERTLYHVDCADLFAEVMITFQLLNNLFEDPPEERLYALTLFNLFATERIVFEEVCSVYMGSVISCPALTVTSETGGEVLNWVMEGLENAVIQCVKERLYENQEAYDSIELRCFTNGFYALLSVAAKPHRLLLDLAAPWEYPCPALEAADKEVKERVTRAEKEFLICRRTIQMSAFFPDLWGDAAHLSDAHIITILSGASNNRLNIEVDNILRDCGLLKN